MFRIDMRYLLLSYLLIYCANCFAQSSRNGATSNKGFTPLKNIIFEDNFSDDSLGQFPHKWKTKKCTIPGCTKTHAIVIQEGADKVLSTDYMTYVKPTLTGALTDSFTIECDLILKSQKDWLKIGFHIDGKASVNSINREFMFYNEDQHFSVYNITNTGRYVTTFGHSYEDASYDRVDMPQVVVSHSKWYHLGISYNHHHISCYLDSTRIFEIPDCGYLPLGLFIGLSDSAICKHIVVANGKLLDFDKLITEKKLVTHSILFESNKAVIKDGSDLFLAQLAAWLLKNPAIRIEIDGHTDSVGSVTSNLNLSVERAEEVKRQLEAKGVPTARLSTKGMGATMPLRSNKTEEGKAENRRVEFILLEKKD